MANKQPINVCKKSVEWLKNTVGVSDDFITLQGIKGFTAIYVYNYYPYGGGNDQIGMTAFREVIPDEHVQKYFANSKIRGQLMGDVCMIDLRS